LQERKKKRTKERTKMKDADASLLLATRLASSGERMLFSAAENIKR
jgi:hypothetical protein